MNFIAMVPKYDRNTNQNPVQVSYWNPLGFFGKGRNKSAGGLF